MGKLLDLFARPRAFKLCTIHPRWTRGRFLGTTESTLWHTEIFGDFLPVTWYLQMNFRYWYDRIDVFICLHIFIYIHICMYTLWWLPKYPSCLILVIQSDITQLVQVSIGRSSHARSAPCAWWVYPTATTFRKARHHRSCYVRRAMWWMVVIQGVGESGEGWFGERVGWGWWMVGFEFKCNLCECGQLKDWPTAWVWLSDGALPSSQNKSTQVVAQPWWINLRNCHHLGSLDNVYKA